jgi:TrmH family RNA methyltransferase
LITSTQNPKIKWVRLLQADPQARREEGVFVIEGVRLAEEALAAGWPARLVLHTEDISPRSQAVVEGFAAKGATVEGVSAQVMRHASDTQTPQGVLAALGMQPRPLPQAPGLVLIADGIRDPGNLGSMLRTAAAAGVEAVLVSAGGVEVYAPKVVRAAMGAHFRLPVGSLFWEEIATYVKQANLRVYLADAEAGEAYTRCDLRAPLGLIVGGEAEGAGEAARRLAEVILHIPMASGVESLNAAAATAVLLFEVKRQRE